MYAQILLAISVRGIALSPITAARAAVGVIGFINAAFSLRFAAVPFLLGASFFAGALFRAGCFGAAFGA